MKLTDRSVLKCHINLVESSKIDRIASYNLDSWNRTQIFTQAGALGGNARVEISPGSHFLITVNELIKRSVTHPI